MAFEAATLSGQLGRPSLFVALAAQRNAGDVDVGGLPAVWNLGMAGEASQHPVRFVIKFRTGKPSGPNDGLDRLRQARAFVFGRGVAPLAILAPQQLFRRLGAELHPFGRGVRYLSGSVRVGRRRFRRKQKILARADLLRG